jgi:DNA primase
MKKTGKSEFEAIKYIAEKNNIDIKNIFNKNEYDTINANAALYKVNEKANFVYTSLLYNPENVQYLEYLYKRKFSDELIKKFGIGYSGEGNLVPELLMSDNFKITKKQLIEVGIMNIKDNGYESVLLRNRVTFPIKDENGNIVAFSGRIIVSNEKDVKYLHSLETKIFSKSKILFNLHNVLALKEDKKLIICEGYMDVIGFYRAGVENVVATMGTALTENHISLIKKYKTLILSFDKDDAGINAVISNARKLIKLQFDV